MKILQWQSLSGLSSTSTSWSCYTSLQHLFRRGTARQASIVIDQLASSGHFDTWMLDGILSRLSDTKLINDKHLVYYLASLYLQIGDKRQAHELLRGSGRVTLEQKWFASVMLYSMDSGLCLPTLSNDERRCLEYLGSRIQIADTAMANLFNSRRRFAVIGNAPGLPVDTTAEHTCSVYFNEYQKNPRLPDNPLLHVVTPAWKPVSPVLTRNLCVTGNNIFHRRSRVWRKFLNLPEYERLYTLPQSLWRDLSKQLQSPPSAGICLLAYVANYVDLAGKSGLIGGFTDTDAGLNHSYDAVPMSTRHNWSAEIELRQEYLRSMRVAADTVSVC